MCCLFAQYSYSYSCLSRAQVNETFALLFYFQDTHDSRISVANLSAREDGQAVLWQTTRGLWSDLTVSATCLVVAPLELQRENINGILIAY